MRCSPGEPWWRSRTGCTRRTTPTGSRSSSTGVSRSWAATRNCSPGAGSTRLSGRLGPHNPLRPDQQIESTRRPPIPRSVVSTLDKPVVAAHRGAKRLAPENTLAAFEKAISMGAAALELDTHLTSDGRIVVLHDARVDRTTNGSGAVRSFTADEIAALDAGSWHSPDFAGERIPTLEQVLELTKAGTRLNIELKSWAGDAAPIIDLVRRHDAVGRSLL